MTRSFFSTFWQSWKKKVGLLAVYFIYVETSTFILKDSHTQLYLQFLNHRIRGIKQYHSVQYILLYTWARETRRLSMSLWCKWWTLHALHPPLKTNSSHSVAYRAHSTSQQPNSFSDIKNKVWRLKAWVSLGLQHASSHWPQVATMQAGLCHRDLQPELLPSGNMLWPPSCINYPIQCCQLINWRLTGKVCSNFT